MSDEQQDAAVIAEQAAAERTRADQIVAAVESAREDLLRVWHKARRVDGQDVDTPHTDAISAVCNALFYAAEMPSVVHKDGGNEEIGRNILRIKAWEYYQRIEKAEAERDAARAELATLRVVLGGVPEVLESYAESVQPHLDSSPNPAAGLALSIIRAKAAAIRALEAAAQAATATRVEDNMRRLG